MAKTIDASQIFNPISTRPLSLIILNRPFRCDKIFLELWKKSAIQICADGGANRLYEAVQDKDGFDPKAFIPSAIIGDGDSIIHEHKAFYDAHNCSMIINEDQYSTDFAKSMHHARTLLESKESDIVVLGSISGRVDQGLGLIGELLRESKQSDVVTDLWLLSECSLSWILNPGETVITGVQTKYFAKNVGIIPICGSSEITLRGFEWDVKDWPTEMGKNVSSSNHIVSSEVSVSTLNWMLFTIERDSDLKEPKYRSEIDE